MFKAAMIETLRSIRPDNAANSPTFHLPRYNKGAPNVTQAFQYVNLHHNPA